LAEPSICTRKVRHLASFMRTFGSHQFAVQTLAFAFFIKRHRATYPAYA